MENKDEQEKEYALLLKYFNMVDKDSTEMEEKIRVRSDEFLVSATKTLKIHRDNIVLMTEDANKKFKNVIMKIDEGMEMMGRLKKLLVKYRKPGISIARQSEEDRLSNYLGTKEFQYSTRIKGVRAMIERFAYAVKNDRKRCFLDWLKEVDGSALDFRQSLNNIKIQAFQIGINICTMLLDLRLFTPKNIDMEAKFGLLKDCMKWVIAEDNSSFVIRKIVNVLESMDGEIRHMIESELQFINQMDAPEQETNPEAMELVEEEYVDSLIVQLLDGINNLEVTFILQNVPASKILLQGALLTLERFMETCRKGLEEIEPKIRKFKSDSAQRYGHKIMESIEYKLVEIKIKESWT